MLKYFIKRIIQAIPLLLLVTIISYAIICFTPGDPINQYVNPMKTQHVDKEALRHSLGLDKPVYVRYFIWLYNIVQGNFGYSLTQPRTVVDVIFTALPNSLILSILSLIIALLIAIPAGIICALKRNKFIDYFFSAGAFVGMSIPSFWFGLLLILVFSLKLDWLPISGMRSNFEQFDLIDRLRHMILPLIVLVFPSIAGTMKMIRASMIESLSQDYVRTAKSKGLPARVVIVKHALRNAMIPIITGLGMSLPGLFGGAAIVEQIFAWPGIGKAMLDSSFGRDYPVMMANILITAVLIILGNLLADIFYAVADPRIKYD